MAAVACFTRSEYLIAMGAHGSYRFVPGILKHFDSLVFPETGHVYTDEMEPRMLEWFERKQRRKIAI